MYSYQSTFLIITSVRYVETNANPIDTKRFIDWERNCRIYTIRKVNNLSYTN